MLTDQRAGALAEKEPEIPAAWSESARHTYREAGHELILAHRTVTEREAHAVGFGTASFALVVEPPVLILCYQFGEAIPWSVAPYRWHLLPPAERFVTPFESIDSADRAIVRVSLVDERSGRLRARRNVPLSLTITRAWNAFVRRHASRSCSTPRYNAALSQFFRRFPTTEELLGYAIATSSDGD